MQGSTLRTQLVAPKELPDIKTISQQRGCIRRFRVTRDVHIVEECVQPLRGQQLGVDGEQGRVLSQRIQPRHQGVTLLPTLALPHVVPHAPFVIKHVAAGLPIEECRERKEAFQSSVPPQGIEHARPGDVVIRTNAVNAQHRCPGSVSVATRRARTTASGPALVLSAYWKGAQASRKAFPNCCAKVRDETSEDIAHIAHN